MLLVSSLAVLATPAFATEVPTPKLFTLDGAAFGDGWFGESIAIDGDYAVIGAPGQSGADDTFPAGYKHGTAYVYHNTGAGWVLDAELRPPMMQERNCGYAVGLVGNVAAISCPYNTGGSKIYVYTRGTTGWTQTQVIEPPGVGGLGRALSFDGDTLALSAFSPRDVFIYALVEGQFVHQAQIPTPADAEGGNYISLSGDTIAISAHGDNERGILEGGGASGAIYVHTRTGTTWSLQQKVFGDDTGAEDRFGTRLKLEGDRLIGATPGWIGDAGTAPRGSAYVFDRSGGVWTQTAQLFPSDACDYCQFGVGLAMLGENVYVGTHVQNTPVADGAGAMYEFNVPVGGTATELTKHYAADGFGNMLHGWSADADGSTIMVGARNGRDSNGRVNGAVYVLSATIPPPPDTRPAAFVTDLVLSTSYQTENVAFGIANDATAGYDAGLDGSAPPAPPGNSWLRAVFSGEGAATELRTSIQGRGDTVAWPLTVQARNADDAGAMQETSVSVSWDTADHAGLPADLLLVLVDGTTVVDMRSASSHVVSFRAGADLGRSGAESRTLWVLLQRAPDLGIAPVDVTFVSPVVLGEPATVHASVANVGGASVAATVQLHEGDTLLASAPLGTLANGGSSAVDLVWTPSTSGPHALRVSVVEIAPAEAAGTLADNVVDITVLAGTPFDLDLAAGWQMISLPVEPFDTDVADALPGVEAVYSWNGAGYEAAEQVHAGVGYWAYVSSPVSVTLLGEALDVVHHTDLASGWHMIAAPIAQAPVRVTSPVEEGAAEPNLFQWGGMGYVSKTLGVDDVQPGTSSWLFVVEGLVDVEVGAPLAA